MPTDLDCFDRSCRVVEPVFLRPVPRREISWWILSFPSVRPASFRQCRRSPDHGRRQSCLSRDPACYDPTAHRRSCVRRVLYAEISRRTNAMRLVLRATLIAAMMRTPQVFNNIKRCVQNFRYERMYEETAAFRGRRWDRSWTHAEGVSCHVRCRPSRIYTHSGRLAGVLCRAQSTKHGSSQKRNSVVLSRTCRSAAENQTLGIA